MGNVVVLLLLVAAGFYLFPRPTKHKHKPAYSTSMQAQPRAGQYHAVSIQSGNRACKAVKTFGNMRFLADNAPHLPVRECKAGRCQCRYVHHDDRRSPKRRRSALNPATDLYVLGGNAERRRASARRSTDRHPESAPGIEYDDFEWAN